MTYESEGHWRIRGGMPGFAAKLQDDARREMAVAFLGGSITEGYGASDPDRTSWRALTERYFAERYPDKRWRFVNAGVGGTHSAFGAHRLDRHAFADGPIDLLFVEFAVNDGQMRTRAPQGRAEAIRGVEGIVRRCRTVSPDADIVLLYAADETSLAEEEPIFVSAHEEVAERYGLPSVSFLSSVKEKSDAGAWRTLAPDGVHPNDDGYALYAASLRELLDRALATPVAGAAPIRRMLPEPIRPDSYDRAGMASAMDARRIKGMSWRGRPDNTVNWRYPAGHWHGEGSEASFAIETYGKGAGLLLLCGPDSGAFECAVNGGAYHRYDPYDEWCPHFYRPVMVPIADLDAPGPIEIAVRGVDRVDDPARGNSLRLLGWLHRE